MCLNVPTPNIPAHYLVQPKWETPDGFKPYYHVPGNRPDYNRIASIDASMLPGIASMERYGMAIDIPYLQDLTVTIDKKIAELLVEIKELIPPDVLAKLDPDNDEQSSDIVSDYADPKQSHESSALDPSTGDASGSGRGLASLINIDSPIQLGILLFEYMGLGKGKQLKKSKGGDRLSTDKEQLNNLKLDNPIIAKLLEYRAHKKAKTTYTTKLPLIAVLHRKSINTPCHLCGRRHYEDVYRVHTTLLTTRAATGRLASKNPNLQNIPARSELGKLIRAAFMAEIGYVLLDADYAQAELRLLGHRAQERKILATYRNREDIHIKTAMYAFKIDDPSKVDKELHRAPCKNVNFGIVYGLTAEGLYDLMLLSYATANRSVPSWLTVDWCEEFLNTWFEIYPEVRGYLDLEYGRAEQYGMTWTEYGRIRRIPEVYSAHKHIRQAGLRQAGNAPTQGTCADVVRVAIRVLEDYFSNYHVDVLRIPEKDRAYQIMSIHDESIIEAPEHKADAYSKAQVQLMSGVTENWMSVELPADGKFMTRWEK